MTLTVTQHARNVSLFELPGGLFINATQPLKRKQMSADPYDNWRRALAGEKPQVYESDPWCGYFAVQDRSPDVKPAKGNRWPLIPCAIWHENGELVAERAGARVPVEWVWPFAASRPITYATYRHWHENRRWPDEEQAA